MRDTLAAPPARTQAPLHHLTEPQRLDRTLIEQLLQATSDFEQRAGQAQDRLQGRLLATLFYEPSTRTRFSFEAAMYRLGGQVLSAENAAGASSAAKGQSVADTIQVIAGYADAIVLRHPEVGAVERVARDAKVPVLSAGDGAGQHPTQALLDLYTIKKELGRLDHLRVGLAGDLRYGRTARSLALLLSRFPGNELVMISPAELRMGTDIIDQLKDQRVVETDDFDAAIAGLDVLYQTRIQAERFASPDKYERHRGVYVVNLDVMHRFPDGAILMHPLPRVGEIDPLVDADPRAAYFRQARNGLWTRMAVLDWAMER